MKVALLNLPDEENFLKESRCQQRASAYQSVFFPITLAYMAALLRKNRDEVSIIDAVGQKMSLEQVIEELKKFQPDFVVISVTTPTIISDVKIIKRMKKEIASKYVIFGIHATYFARELIKIPEIDIVVKGEPEITVSELTKKQLSQINGIVYKEKGKIRETPDVNFLDLDKLPFPAWNMINLEPYRVPITNKKYVLVATGRGCPFQCTFCVAPYYYGHKPRMRGIDRVIEEIRFAKKLGISDFFFFEETFTVDREWVMRFCEKIIKEKLNIKWFCNTRVNTFDYELAKRMKDAGCWLISFGIESASEEILKNVRKNISPEQSMKAVGFGKKAGLLTLGHFIFGLPGETNETIEKTIKFAKKLPLDFAEFYIATPYPGSQLFEDYKKTIKNMEWNKFHVAKQVVRKDLSLEYYLHRALKQFYLRPSVIVNMLRIFGIRKVGTLFLTGIMFVKTHIFYGKDKKCSKT